MRALLLLFVAVPIIEMIVLIKVGGAIGALSTVALVFLTAAIGLGLLRQQGPSTLLRAQQKMATGEIPAKEMVEGVFLAVGGALLLTPGFITDAIGFCCLIPGIRHVIIAWGMRHIRFSAAASQTGGYHAGQGSRGPTGRVDGEGHTTIDGDYTREDQ